MPEKKHTAKENASKKETKKQNKQSMQNPNKTQEEQNLKSKHSKPWVSLLCVIFGAPSVVVLFFVFLIPLLFSVESEVSFSGSLVRLCIFVLQTQNLQKCAAHGAHTDFFLGAIKTGSNTGNWSRVAHAISLPRLRICNYKSLILKFSTASFATCSDAPCESHGCLFC